MVTAGQQGGKWVLSTQNWVHNKELGENAACFGGKNENKRKYACVCGSLVV